MLALISLMCAFMCASFMCAIGAGCGSATAPSPSAPSAPSAPLDVPKLGAQAKVADPPGTVRFARQPARVGDHFHTLVHSTSTRTNSRGEPETSEYESEFDETVLAVEGPAASRLAVSFVRNTLKRDVPVRTSIDGKAYVVDIHAPNVIDAELKAPPSSDEITRVLDIEPDLGTRTTLDQMIPDRALAVGDHVDELPGALAHILHPRFWRLDRGVALVGRVGVDEATFDVLVEATSIQSGMKLALRGPVRIRSHDTQLASFELEGTFVDKDGDKGEMKVQRHIVGILSP